MKKKLTDIFTPTPEEYVEPKSIPMQPDESNVIPLMVDEQRYILGQIVGSGDGYYSVVEILDNGQYHFKKTTEPFNSFIGDKLD